MVTSCIEAVEASPDRLHAVARYFELWALRLSGFLADVSRCSRCGRQLAAVGSGRVFATAEFALHCESCADRLNRELEPALYGQLRSARYLPPSEWSLSYTRADGSLQEGFARIVRTLLERHLERSPRGHSASLPVRRTGAN